MSNDTEETSPIPAEERFQPGEQCGVCRFPTGTGQICGNPVYAVTGKGRLPKYCGMDGQAVYQQQHGTAGVPGHLSERAGYPRKTFGMTPAAVNELAERLSKEAGVQRRVHLIASNDAVAEGDSDATADSPGTAPEPDDTRMRVRALAVVGSGTEKSAKLAEYLLAASELAAQLGDEMTALRADADNRVGREASLTRAATADKERAERELADAVEAHRAALAQADERVRQASEQAEQAHTDKLHAEGALKAAEARIAELERKLTGLETAHRDEIERVRATEAARTERFLLAFARRTGGPEEEAEEPVVQKPSASAVQDLAKRVQRGQVQRQGSGEEPAWLLSNAVANRRAAATLEWMLEQGQISVDADGTAHVEGGLNR
ncbi:hypothetical protein [Nocardia brasiliensis]|uniref:hypothetical protein n=1 Tax=Nocardia brasiliensis TaxID=37326 RepID=UPI002455B09D|nr:hypothetical protein [Nocardia brasiliensis]